MSTQHITSNTFITQLASNAGIIIGILLTHWAILFGVTLTCLSLSVLYVQPVMQNRPRLERVSFTVLLLCVVLPEPAVLLDVITVITLVIYVTVRHTRNKSTTEQPQPSNGV